MNNSFLTSNSNNLNRLLNIHLDTVELEKCLSTEILNCRYRRLVNSTEWLFEILNSKNLKIYADINNDFTNSISPYLSEYIESKTFFNKRQFSKCSHLLKDILRKHDILDFLYFYSRFKAILKNLCENEDDLMNNESQKYTDSLISLKEDVKDYIDEYQNHDAYMLYLYGIILKKLSFKDDARLVFVKALNRNQYLWPVWYELTDITKFDDISLPNNWMRNFFEVKALKLTNNKIECDKVINNLMKNGFDNVGDLKIDLAIVNEEINNSAYSLELFNKIYEKDPYRMDYFCTLSNILFVQENHKMLGELSQHCVKIDRYRYETSCVIGNFYSLRNQHEKAVIYFHRALKMNPADSNTWLLTAHSYFELQNHSEAIYFYKKAFEINPYDYRACYGLGQIYQLIKNYELALFYYRRTFELQPKKNARILVSLGMVYEKLYRNAEAKTCYYQAHLIGDIENIALFKLGEIHEKMKDMSKAAEIFSLFIEEAQDNTSTKQQNLGYAYIFLATYYWKYKFDDEKALSFAVKCCEIPCTKTAGEDLMQKITIGSNDDSTDSDADELYNLENYTMNNFTSVEDLSQNVMDLNLEVHDNINS